MTGQKGRVPNPYLEDYERAQAHELRHRGASRTKDAIIPDLLIHDYPLPSTELGQDGAVARDGPAIIEIKTIHFTPNVYRVNARGSDTRATRIRKEYADKAHKCDLRFAPDLTSTADETGARQIGPFERALSSFTTGGPIPVVVGGFGETNKGVDEVLKTLAKRAATTEQGLALSPHTDLHHPDGSFPLLLAQIRRALGVAIVRGNAELKLRRLHFIRRTESAAREASARHRHDFPRDYRFSSTCPNWFRAHAGDQYHAFNQFYNRHRSPL